jgi:hypothetical protein
MVRSSRIVVVPNQINGIISPSNNAAGSNMRVVFSGANLPNRKHKTVIWSAKYVQHTGYYAFVWDSEGDATWHGGLYECGAHPFPCDGSANAQGQATGGTGAAGTVHYYEIAGAGSAVDYIASSGPGSVYIVTKGVWVKQAITDQIITVTTTDDTVERTFYVDLSDTSKKIVTRQANPLARTPSAPIFALFSSEWTATGDANEEAASGTFRNWKIFNNAALSAADIVSESNYTANGATTAAGIASVFYTNVNPTPDDISDKSGAGHSPSWANANHGTLYTE